MIKQKLKFCSICGKLTVLWRSNPAMCKDCSNKAKVSVKPPKYATKEIKKVSTKQQKLNAAYMVLRNAFMKNHKACEANLIELAGCTRKATECHHSKGRGQYFLDDTTYIALCHNCHVFIENSPEWAKNKGYSFDRLKKYV